MSGRIRTSRLNAAPVIFATSIMLLAGCSTVRVTDPPRTATEQFLLSQAASTAVERLRFGALHGRRVWVDDSYFAASEAPFVIGAMRAKMLIEGVRLVPERDQAQVVIEVRSGGVGIDRTEFLLGVPPLGGSQLTPELSLIKNLNQRGVAEVAYVAYWRTTGEVVAFSGPFVGRSFRDDWWYAGFGPSSTGDINPVTREGETDGLRAIVEDQTADEPLSDAPEPDSSIADAPTPPDDAPEPAPATPTDLPPTDAAPAEVAPDGARG